MKWLAIALCFVCLPVTASAKKEYELCLTKLAAAEANVDRVKETYTGPCHYYFQDCSRPNWNGHHKPLVRDLTFVYTTRTLFQASAKAVEIGNICMTLLDKVERAK